MEKSRKQVKERKNGAKKDPRREEGNGYSPWEFNYISNSLFVRLVMLPRPGRSEILKMGLCVVGLSNAGLVRSWAFQKLFFLIIILVRLNCI